MMMMMMTMMMMMMMMKMKMKYYGNVLILDKHVCAAPCFMFGEVESFLESLRFPVESKVHQPLTLDQKMQGLTDEQASDKSNLGVSFTFHMKLDVCTAT